MKFRHLSPEPYPFPILLHLLSLRVLDHLNAHLLCQVGPLHKHFRLEVFYEAVGHGSLSKPNVRALPRSDWRGACNRRIRDRRESASASRPLFCGSDYPNTREGQAFRLTRATPAGAARNPINGQAGEWRAARYRVLARLPFERPGVRGGSSKAPGTDQRLPNRSSHGGSRIFVHRTSAHSRRV